MEGVSIIIPVFNKFEITNKCIEHIIAHNNKTSFEIIVVDNGSTDKTPVALSKEKDMTYIRNKSNVGLSKAYNHAVKEAQYDTYCFMHNDVFVYEEDRTARIRDFILSMPDAGVVGLYGAKTMRKDGGFRGKTIVHSKMNSPSIKRPFEKAAVVDGLLLATSRTVFESIGGFNEDFTIHYYDKDLSMRALKSRFMNYVLSTPFEHLIASTRKHIESDDIIREEAREHFIRIWGASLPADVSTQWQKLLYALKF
jgi:GT2 family glycosyltransferase